MQFFNFKQIIAIALGTSFLAFSGAQAATKIEVDSYGKQGSYLGPWGYLGTETFSAEQGDFQVHARLKGAGARVSYFATDSDDSLFLDLRSPFQPLTKGLYESATSDSLDFSKPYLRFGLNGSAFTTTTGAFQVFELEKNLSGEISSFAASFRISSHLTPTGQSEVVGRIWFNSDAQLSAVPEPQSLVLMLAGLAVMAWGTKRRTALLA